jgi:Na+-transporting NADH:ubiquinone oxidoreductase subunit A
MGVIKVHGGHRFRIKHGPKKEVTALATPARLALSPAGETDLKPRVVVKEGESVKIGQELFHHKKDGRIRYTSPAGGTVKTIHYGARRKLLAVEIEVSESEEKITWPKVGRGDLAGLGAQTITERLLEAGLWPRFKTFPGWGFAPISDEIAYPEGREPPPVDEEHAPPPPPTPKVLYVSALATEPHQPDTNLALKGNEEIFSAGLEVVKQLTPKTYLFTKAGDRVSSKATSVTGVDHREIQDKYPAENFGLHLWATETLKKGEAALGLQLEDVLQIGHLFLEGELKTERLYAVAGKGAPKQVHVQARLGLKVSDLAGVTGDRDDGREVRFVAGGLFSGRKAAPTDFLSPKEGAVNVLIEDTHRIPFVFFRPGFDRLTLSRVWASGWNTNAEREASTSNNGQERACVQCGYCTDICPVKLLPDLVFKSALAGDFEKMEEVGIQDCIDCGLCTFVCPSKIEMGQHIAEGKALMAKEG